MYCEPEARQETQRWEIECYITRGKDKQKQLRDNGPKVQKVKGHFHKLGATEQNAWAMKHKPYNISN